MKQFALLPALLLIWSCNSTTALKSVNDPDTEVPCPAGSQSWNLQVTDQRADRRDSARVVGLVEESLSRSLPGCRWAGGPQAGTIAIEIHRFSAKLDGSIWDAAAEWSVAARDAAGRTMTEFESSFEHSRPNYRGYNNEREVLQAAFEDAMRHTLKGLRALSPLE